MFKLNISRIDVEAPRAASEHDGGTFLAPGLALFLDTQHSSSANAIRSWKDKAVRILASVRQSSTRGSKARKMVRPPEIEQRSFVWLVPRTVWLKDSRCSS